MAAKIVHRSMGMMRHATRIRQSIVYSAMKKIGTLDEKIHRATHQQPTRKLRVLLKDGMGDRQCLLEEQDWTEADIAACIRDEQYETYTAGIRDDHRETYTAGIRDDQYETYTAGIIDDHRETYTIQTVVVNQVADATGYSVAQQQDILKIKDEAVGILVDIGEEGQGLKEDEGVSEMAKLTDFLRVSVEARSEMEDNVTEYLEANEEARGEEKAIVADYHEPAEDGSGEKKAKGRLRRIGSYLRKKFTSRRKYKQL